MQNRSFWLTSYALYLQLISFCSLALYDLLALLIYSKIWKIFLQRIEFGFWLNMVILCLEKVPCCIRNTYTEYTQVFLALVALSYIVQLLQLHWLSHWLLSLLLLCFHFYTFYLSNSISRLEGVGTYHLTLFDYAKYSSCSAVVPY